MSSNKNKSKLIITIAILFILASLITIFFYIYPIKKIQDLKNLSVNTYNSVFVSMYPIEGFSEESFAAYRGLDTYIAVHNVRNISELSKYLDTAFCSNNNVTTVYIGLDPHIIFSSGATTEEAMAEDMASLLNFFSSYPNVTFEVLLPAPTMSQWTVLDSEEISDILMSYRYAISCMEPHTNVLCFFAGGEEWLIRNDSNYANNYAFNELVSDKILCSTFCDRLLQINHSNADTILKNLYNMILVEKTTPTIYPDMSDKTIVFFGDSILGLQNGSYSIPGVINSLTGATVYNYAVGGTTAYDANHDTDIDESFHDRLDKFLSKSSFATQDNTYFPYEDYASNNENLIFVINYGYNDYLQAFGTENFLTSLENGISRLQEAYPNAQIVLMSPYQCMYAHGNAVSYNDKGEAIAEYAQIVDTTAARQETIHLDMPLMLSNEINETNYFKYFNDECHYSEHGRFFVAKQIISVLE